MSPRMEPHGKGKKGILVIGEAPGEWEDRRGKQWQGKVGRVLRRTLREFDIELFEDCVCVNAVNCRPPNNKTPSAFQIQCCRPKVWKVIEEFRPKLILLLGNAALESFLAERWKKKLGGITRWRGWRIPDREVEAWVCPTYHPSYVERKGRGESVEELIWKQDLESALSLLSEPLPYRGNDEKCIECTTDVERIRRFLKELRECKIFVAFDYETTGLKPHSKGHRVVCVSICTADNFCISFPITSSVRGIFKGFLRSEIPKEAQNIKFEDTWSRFYFREEVRNWVWDTMLASHVLDNRPGVTGLKFQVYVRFGVLGYDDKVAPYLSSNSKDANAFNRIDKVPLNDLLLYCGLDSLYERRLAGLQMEEIRNGS
ncbi:MAG TPA: hypothetical protein ENF41_01130 [Candidatus Bathyarchaeota archaeon]|nr:hypothetical protein [Candidatus Bathyarchaeota archaeon]